MYRMIGKTFTKVEANGNQELVFSNDTESFTFFHQQFCCEDVYIESIVGDLSDLEDVPIRMAEESSNKGDKDDYTVEQWTFYKFATIKGYVDVRWYGTSNGYYSTDVSVEYLQYK